MCVTNLTSSCIKPHSFSSTPFETQSAKDLAKGALEIYRAEFKDIKGGAETHEQTVDAVRETKRIENMIEKAKSKA